MADAERIPAFVNPESGKAEGARQALASGPFDVHEVQPDKLKDEISAEVKNGPKRILIAGGDGSIRTAVEAVAGSGVELAVIPSGTLNHFAKDHELPADLDEAAKLAVGPAVGPVDVGRVGESLFHGTSSIGAYVQFMKMRDRFESKFGYKIGTFLAGIWTFFTMRMMAVELEVDGQKRIYRTPLLFVAVGERELKIPTLDAELDAFIVDHCKISMTRSHTRISFDGESQSVDTPLEYQLERDILLLVGGETSRPAGRAFPRE